MILPIYAYGTKVLKKKAEDISSTYEELESLIENMWETMYNARGVGLAAPQIGRSIRLFIIDTTQIKDENDSGGIKKIFINAQKLEDDENLWTYEEGCLSIPDVRGDVDRPKTLTLRYCNEKFEIITETFKGVEARVIQHEYDHIEGILFTELLKPLKKRRIKRRLDEIRKGIVEVEYPMRFI